MQWRLSFPLSLFVLGLLALPLSRTSPREGRYARLGMALFTYLIYFYLQSLARLWVERGLLSEDIGIWGVHAVVAVPGHGRHDQRDPGQAEQRRHLDRDVDDGQGRSGVVDPVEQLSSAPAQPVAVPRHPVQDVVRGHVESSEPGAIGVVELDRIDDLNALRRAFVERGAFIRPIGSVIYLAPALTIGEDDVAFLTRVIGEVVRGIG